MTSPLVSSEWLNKNLDNSDLIILDASPKTNKSGLSTEFENLRIKGARFFDLEGIFSDPNGRFPNTFPSSEQFENGCRKLGINNSSKIIVYDNLGIYTSPRVWWMFKTMGHENVHVLNGGLPDWIVRSFETEKIIPEEYETGNFTADLQAEKVRDYDFIQSNVKTQEQILIDARSDERFKGISIETRKGLKSGHIPNSFNIPFSLVLNNNMYKSKEELKRVFEGIENENKALIFTCGSGITACIVLLASEIALKNSTSVYDGSWTEWATLNTVD